MGRSRGGLTTKIRALVDALGLPIRLKLTEGQAHDGRSAADMLDGLGEGDVLLGDRAYDSDAMRAALAARGAWACIKPCPTANASSRSARSSVDFASSTSASSVNLIVSAPSPTDTTNAPTTSSPQSNSLPSGFGRGIISR